VATRIPNPCDGIVEDSRCQEGFELIDGQCVPIEQPQPPPPFTGRLEIEERPPVFTRRTIQQPVQTVGRKLVMIDEEYFNVSEVPFGHGIKYEDQDSIYTPAWYYSQKVQQNIIRDPRDTTSRDYVHLDPFRAGLMYVWGYYRDEANGGFHTHYISNTIPDNNPLSYSLPVFSSISDTEQNDNDLALYQSSLVTLIFSTAMANGAIKTLTNNYSSFSSDPKKFYDVYLNGSGSVSYTTLSPEAKSKYKYGVIPSTDSTFYDSVFEHPLPFHENETNFLNIPVFHIVEASLVNRGFQTEGLGSSGRIISEYQKPSIYRSFFEEKNLETLELNNLQNGCIPADRIQKFPSEQVEDFPAANTKLEKQSESFVRIKIATRQGRENFIGQLLRNSKMDRHVLDLITTEDEEYTSHRELFAQITDDAIKLPGMDIYGDLFTDNDRSQHGIFTKVNNEFAKKIEDQSVYAGGTRIQDTSEYPMGYYNHDKPFLLSFEDAITSHIFLSELRDHVKAQGFNRTFEEVLNGRKAHSEIIAYHVEKADAETGEIIQDFYFSDSNEVLEIDFVDNQILLGKKYRYRVFAVNMVLATEYKYLQATGFTSARGPYTGPLDINLVTTLPVNARLKYSIVETPYFEKTISVFDKPPMFPQINFLPYQGVEDEIGFLLQSGGGEVLELPMPIRNGDSDAFATMAEAQGKGVEEALLYGTDDLPTGFELLCMQGSEPTSYSDFSTAQVKTFDAHGKTGFFKLNIKPNEYYYAIFRTLEGDMISNPTEVFRFMMVSYENGIYFDVQTIEMEQPKETNLISFEKILKIEPHIEHTFLNIAPESESAEDRTNFRMSAPVIVPGDIGRQDRPLWGKKLKIRLRSRTTGKELDIKLIFEKEVKTLEPDANSPQPEVLPSVCDT
jgi:hypothetical protein